MGKEHYFWNHDVYHSTMENLNHDIYDSPITINDSRQVGGGFSDLQRVKKVYLHPIIKKVTKPHNLSHVDVTEVKIYDRPSESESQSSSSSDHSYYQPHQQIQQGYGFTQNPQDSRVIPVSVSNQYRRVKETKPKTKKKRKHRKISIRKDIFS